MRTYIAAILVVCAALAVQGLGRSLSQTPNCSAFSSAGASSESRNAVVSATTEAFAECTGDKQTSCSCSGCFSGSQCETQAIATASAVAQAVAKAITNVFVQVASTSPTCVADASATASANATATALASAYASAVAQGCNDQKQSQYEAQVKEAFLNAVATSQAYAKTNGVGNAEAFNNAAAEDVRPVIATSLSAAVATCKCGQGTSQVGTGTQAGVGPGNQTTTSTSGANTSGTGGTQQAGASGSAQTSCIQRPANLPSGFQLTGGLTFCP